MRKNILRIVVLICTLSLLCTSVFASLDASAQLASYESRVRHLGEGELEVFISVFAVDDMDVLGASNVFIYQKNGSSWIACDSVNSSYPGMITRDSTIHEDYVYINTYEDSELKVEVIIYAKDYSGASDSRVLTYYVNT